MFCSLQATSVWMHYMKHLAALSFVLLFASMTYAGWEPVNGPYGGPVNCLAGKQQVALAGTSAGLFRSSDGGLTWVEANQGLTYAWTGIYSVAMTDSWVYAGTAGGYVYRSSNMGLSWTGRHIGMAPDSPVISLGSRGDSILAGTEFGLYLSTDYGQNWSGLNQGLPVSTVVKSILAQGTLLFIATDQGLYRSINGGTSWTKINGIEFTNAGALAVADGKLFVSAAGGVFRSDDNGESWLLKSAGLTNPYINRLVANGPDLFACTQGGGVFCSKDLGEIWMPVNQGLNCSNISSLAIQDSVLFAGTLHGVARSDNYAGNWSYSSQGMFRANVEAFNAIYDTLFVSGGTGLYRSSNQGNTWEDISGRLCEKSVSAIIRSGTNLFAGSDSVYRSPDNGQSWIQSSQGFVNSSVVALAASGSSVFASAYMSGVYASGNQGETWSARGNGMPSSTDVRDFAVSGSKLYAATNRGLFLSEDEGITWSLQNLDESLTKVFVDESGIYAIPELPGLYFSADGGETWENLAQSMTGNPLISMVSQNGKIFISNRDGIFVSYDHGSEYVHINPENPELNKSLLLADSAYLYAGGENTGIWRRALEEFTAIAEHGAHADFRIFPNPVKDVLNLYNAGEKSGVASLYSMHGELLLNWPVAKGMMKIDVNFLDKGVYPLIISSGKTSFVFKVIRLL